MDCILLSCLLPVGSCLVNMLLPSEFNATDSVSGVLEVKHVSGACPEFKCELGQMACKVKSPNDTSVCIGPQDICDGKVDCPLGEDEKTELCSKFFLCETVIFGTHLLLRCIRNSCFNCRFLRQLEQQIFSCSGRS